MSSPVDPKRYFTFKTSLIKSPDFFEIIKEVGEDMITEFTIIDPSNTPALTNIIESYMEEIKSTLAEEAVQFAAFQQSIDLLAEIDNHILAVTAPSSPQKETYLSSVQKNRTRAHDAQKIILSSAQSTKRKRSISSIH